MSKMLKESLEFDLLYDNIVSNIIEIYCTAIFSGKIDNTQLSDDEIDAAIDAVISTIPPKDEVYTAVHKFVTENTDLDELKKYSSLYRKLKPVLVEVGSVMFKEMYKLKGLDNEEHKLLS